MNSNFDLFIYALGIVFVLSIVWYKFYTNYIRKYNVDRDKNNSMNELIVTIKPNINGNDVVECPVLLPNTDEDIRDALEYVKKSNYAGKLLENLYEQKRV